MTTIADLFCPISNKKIGYGEQVLIAFFDIQTNRPVLDCVLPACAEHFVAKVHPKNMPVKHYIDNCLMRYMVQSANGYEYHCTQFSLFDHIIGHDVQTKSSENSSVYISMYSRSAFEKLVNQEMETYDGKYSISTIVEGSENGYWHNLYRDIEVRTGYDHNRLRDYIKNNYAEYIVYQACIEVAQQYLPFNLASPIMGKGDLFKPEAVTSLIHSLQE